MRKWILFWVLFLLVGCSNRPVEVPVLIYDMNDAYMNDFESRLYKLLNHSFTLKTYNATNSQIIQNEQYDQLMSSKHSLLLVNPVDRLSVRPLIERANANETTIIFFNREPLLVDFELANNAYYVGADAKESAQIQALLVMELFGNNPNQLNDFDKNNDGIIQVVILKGEQGHQDAEARSYWVVQTLLEANYQVEVLETKVANFDKQTAYEQTLSLFETFDDAIEIIIANNDAMALGAIDALVDLEIINDVNMDGIIDQTEEPWLPVVGVDGLEEAILSIKNGYLYGSVNNDSNRMAQIILELTEAILNQYDLNNLSFKIPDNHIIYVNYQPLTIDY